MHAALAMFVAAEEIDPATVRPAPLSAVAFAVLLVVLLLLLRSFLRHLRRVDNNLGPAKLPPGAPAPRGSGAAPEVSGAADPASPAGADPAGRTGKQSTAYPAAPGPAEGDSF
jgi:hypothetical protein